MKRPLRISLLLLSLSCAAGVRAAGHDPDIRYRIDYLPSLGGSSVASSINDLGLVAGRSATVAPVAARRAVIWRNGQIRSLGTLGTADALQSSVVWPVKNLHGLVVGIAETDRIDPEGEDWSCSAFFLAKAEGAPRRQCLGFAWENGRMQPLPTFGGTHGFATGANNLRQVVGWAETKVRDPAGCVAPQKFRFRAALWDLRNGRMRELPPVLAKGDTVSAATALNDRGQVVGISGICDDAVGKFSAIRAVLWENGRVVELGDIGGRAWNTPQAINPQGDVAGFGNQSVTADGAPDFGAFLWTRGGGMKKLPTLAGDTNAQANGLNLWRHAVGRSCRDAGMATGTCDAVLWRDGRVYKLSALVRDFPAGAQLINAVDIDSFGRIAGQAIHPANGVVGYVATPLPH